MNLPHNRFIGTRNKAARDGIENLTRDVMLTTASVKLAKISGSAELGIFLAVLLRVRKRAFEPMLRRRVSRVGSMFGKNRVKPI